MKKMNNKKNPICLHFHIYKNAGSTIDYILKKNFLDDAVTLDTGKPRNVLPYETVLHFIQKHKPTAKSVSSHQFRFPIPEQNEYEFLPIVFVRHPIDRAFSIYYFDKRRKDIQNDLGVEMAKLLKSADYFKWNLEEENHLTKTKNFQTRYLSAKPFRSEVDKTDLELVFEYLKGCRVIGVVDRLDESLVLAEEIFRPFFKNIDFSYDVKQNVSRDREGDLAERLDKGRKEIGNALFEELEKANLYDLQLYSFAKMKLEENIKNLEHFDIKLSNFKKRCLNCNQGQN